jgi:SAM-dependent methyltransferase
VTWEWDPTLFAGAAPHYVAGRWGYPDALAQALRDELGLDGTGRLLDVGCGPGTLTLLLAPLFESCVGVDPDPGMLDEARRSPGGSSIDWRLMRGEDLTPDLGTFRVVTFAQSFHWMDQPLVAHLVRPLLDPDGAWVHVAAMTHRGADGTEVLPYPRPPWDRIEELVAGYLGPVRRAGQGTLPGGTRSGEEDVMRSAGYRGPHRIVVPRGDVLERSQDDVVAAVLSLSGSAPHLFEDRLGDFERDLRAVLDHASPAGRFSERARDVEAVVWRP